MNIIDSIFNSNMYISRKLHIEIYCIIISNKQQITNNNFPNSWGYLYLVYQNSVLINSVKS